MIEITNRHGEIVVKGHAGYAEHGQDIVCAAISTLTQVFVESVRELTKDKIKSDITAGNAVVKYGNLTEQGKLLLDSFLLGIQMICESYPAHVRMESEVNDE